MTQLSAADPLAALRSPRRSLRAPFMLTPLIDVLFLLLIFFMLSSNVSPFAMLQVSAAQQDSFVQDAAVATNATGSATILVQVAKGSLRIDGRTIAHEQATTVLTELLGDGSAALVVLLSRDATVQDAVSLLDGASTLPFSDIQVVSGGDAP